MPQCAFTSDSNPASCHHGRSLSSIEFWLPSTACLFPDQPHFLQILPLNTLKLFSVPGCPFLPTPAKSALPRPPPPPAAPPPEAELVTSFSGSHGTLYLELVPNSLKLSLYVSDAS